MQLYCPNMYPVNVSVRMGLIFSFVCQQVRVFSSVYTNDDGKLYTDDGQHVYCRSVILVAAQLNLTRNTTLPECNLQGWRTIVIVTHQLICLIIHNYNKYNYTFHILYTHQSLPLMRVPKEELFLHSALINKY